MKNGANPRACHDYAGDAPVPYNPVLPFFKPFGFAILGLYRTTFATDRITILKVRVKVNVDLYSALS